MKYKNVVVFIIAFIATGLGFVARGQNGKLFILCEGTFSQKGSLGYLQLPSLQYVHIDSIASYGNDLYQADDSLYIVDGNGDILVYNLLTNQFTDTITGASARQVAVWDKQLLVTSSAEPYFRVFSIPTGFQPLYTLDTTKVRDIAEGIEIVGNKAFVAVNGFGADSLIVIIDLLAQDTFKTVAVAQNPNNIVYDGNTLFIQSLRWTSSDGGLIITHMDTAGNIFRVDSTHIVSYGGFALKDTIIYFNNNQTWGNESVAAYHITTGNVDTNVIAGAYYALYNYGDTLWLSQTDYTSYGNVLYWDGNNLSTPISVHISPRALLFVPETTTHIKNNELTETITIYPNPVQNWLFFSKEIEQVSLYSLTGEKIIEAYRVKKLNLQSLPAGSYVLKGILHGIPVHQIFIKQ